MHIGFSSERQSWSDAIEWLAEQIWILVSPALRRVLVSRVVLPASLVNDESDQEEYMGDNEILLSNLSRQI